MPASGTTEKVPGPDTVWKQDGSGALVFQQIVAINDALRRAQITLYNVDPLGTADAGAFRTFYYQQFVKGVKKPSQVQIGNVELGAITVQSGGRVLN